VTARDGGPRILAVDTTHERGSIALCEDVMPIDAPAGFAHVLYPHLRALLDRHGLSAGDIDCFAAAAGPGSFTGVRVGLACIKGLGEATGKPAVAVSNLEVLARFGSAPLRAVLLDARRGQIYGAVYDAAGGIVVPETVATLTDFLAILPAADLEFIAPDFAPFGDALPWTPRVTAGPDLAGQVARIAAERLARGEARDPAALDANYVRRSDAELFWKE
jgi:tRNA threonylcarbamoyladenosine biosynthesis protein TsaB